MNKFKFYFIVTITTLSLFSCQKDDPVVITPPRAYADQYKTDIADIEEYLNTYYITVINNPGKPDDQDVTITKIPDGGTQPSIMSYKVATTYPKLLIRLVKLHDVDYKLYYLVLRPGIGESPCNVDGVFTAYRGDYLQRIAATTTTPVIPSYITATKFEEVKYPQSFFSLNGTVSGWGETFPQFKKGTFTTNNDGSVSYYEFGAGVMFLPSGLAYYNNGAGSIPSYSPLVFSFKLYEIQRSDLDRDAGTSFLSPDGIPSYLEDLNNDGYMYDFRNTLAYPTPPADAIRYADDTDKDGIPDFFDSDDDGDNYTTRLEITKPGGSNLLLDGPSLYYPYNPIISTPAKATDEKRGIPSYDKVTKVFDYTSPGRLRIHIDKEYPIKP
jgi:hypothetical protein